MKRRIPKRVALGMAILVLAAPTGRARADEKPAAPTSRPATRPDAKAPPAVMKILDALEESGRKYRALRADITYVYVDDALGDREERTGWVAYEKADEKKKTPAKFRIQFQTLKQGRGKTLKDKIDYAFDGLWLTVAKHRIKTITRYQVAAKGEQIEPTKLGRGPLPLPFGQKTDDMLRHFEITTRPVKKTEPKDTEYLHLATRRAFRKSLNFRTLQMWIEKKTHLPAKIVTTDKNDNTKTVTFRNVQTDPKLSDDTFLLPKPPGWTLNVKRLEPGASLTP